MRHSVYSVLACAGLVSTALAQNFELRLEPGSVSPSGLFTISVYGDADVGDGYYSAAFGLEVTSLSGLGSVRDIEWSPGIWAGFAGDAGGYQGDGLHSLVWMSLLVIPECGVFFDCTVPYGTLMGTFTIDVDPVIAETYQISLIPAPQLDPSLSCSFEVVDEDFSNYWVDSQGTLSLVGTSVSVIPAPACIASLLVCGLLNTRRTRDGVS